MQVLQHLTILRKGTDEVAENAMLVIVGKTVFFHSDIEFGEYYNEDKDIE